MRRICVEPDDLDGLAWHLHRAAGELDQVAARLQAGMAGLQWETVQGARLQAHLSEVRRMAHTLSGWATGMADFLKRKAHLFREADAAGVDTLGQLARGFVGRLGAPPALPSLTPVQEQVERHQRLALISCKDLYAQKLPVQARVLSGLYGITKIATGTTAFFGAAMSGLLAGAAAPTVGLSVAFAGGGIYLLGQGVSDFTDGIGDILQMLTGKDVPSMHVYSIVVDKLGGDSGVMWYTIFSLAISLRSTIAHGLKRGFRVGQFVPHALGIVMGAVDPADPGMARLIGVRCEPEPKQAPNRRAQKVKKSGSRQGEPQPVGAN